MKFFKMLTIFSFLLFAVSASAQEELSGNYECQYLISELSPCDEAQNRVEVQLKFKATESLTDHVTTLPFVSGVLIDNGGYTLYVVKCPICNAEEVRTAVKSGLMDWIAENCNNRN